MWYTKDPKVHTSYTNRKTSYILISSACHKLTVCSKHKVHSRKDVRPHPVSHESSPDSHTTLLTNQLTY